MLKSFSSIPCNRTSIGNFIQLGCIHGRGTTKRLTSTLRLFHHNIIVQESTTNSSLRESKTLLSRNLLSRTPAEFTSTYNNSQPSRVLIAQSVHDNKIILIYIVGACIICLTGITLYHIYFINTVPLHTHVPENMPSVDILSLSEVKSQINEEKQKAGQTPIVMMKAVPEEHKLPLTAVFLGINAFFWVMVFKVKSRMISRLYVNNPNHYVKFKKQYMMNTAVSRRNGDEQVSLPQQGQTHQVSSTSIPLPILLQQQQQRLLDELSFTCNTLDKILPGKEVTFSAKDVLFSENDGTFVYLRVGDEQNFKRYFYCAQDKEESKELAEFMKQVSSHRSQQ
ncbi:hypothetical protein C9374_011334 [Naegleria lovaniensis]|uniref:Transmembrane protein n=1 Tax=Naegleria lovaniensis TaxID=51637 RepID=A0AA88GXZ0_NAELO|nr:uncharacterized protein C9374_011334 [Naegleria lovaniensis]KAG2392609.1 hypothetical protein C9374_011334 [Naegleria lovaniensis]